MHQRSVVLVVSVPATHSVEPAASAAACFSVTAEPVAGRVGCTTADEQPAASSPASTPANALRQRTRPFDSLIPGMTRGEGHERLPGRRHTTAITARTPPAIRAGLTHEAVLRGTRVLVTQAPLRRKQAARRSLTRADEIDVVDERCAIAASSVS
jgi:hypothetical protein